MLGASIQRLIEHQAATTPDNPALVSALGSVTYRDLNLRANAVARRLVAEGLRRGGIVAVKMERTPETATILLAVLKAGAAYIWLDPVMDVSWPRGLSICDDDGGREQRWRTLDPASLLTGAQTAPGLPVLTRPTDIACLLPQPDGRRPVLVPHETITTLLSNGNAQDPRWGDDAGALDLWIGLMSGATVSVVGEPVPVAA